MKTVLIIGAGAAGLTLATTLSTTLPPAHHLLLLDTRSYHFHAIAALRASTSPDPAYPSQICIPLDKALDRGRGEVRQGEVVRVDKDTKEVVLRTGERVGWDILVLAMGAKWGSPIDPHPDRSEALSQFAQTRSQIAGAKRILIVGGGSVGVELAGEILETWAGEGKEVTIVHPSALPMSSIYPDKMRRELLRQLEALGCSFIPNDRIETTTPGSASVTTTNGLEIPTDLIFTCTGPTPNSALLHTLSPSSLTPSGSVLVRPTFQLDVSGDGEREAWMDSVYVVGDLAAVPEVKQAYKAYGHAAIVAHNILAHLSSKKLKGYRPPGEACIVTIGSKGGAGVLPPIPFLGRVCVGAWFTWVIKSKGLFVGDARRKCGVSA
ncbi:FAD/NAD(P)-binding domain-containing protein [Saitoella complicata NRRL Y-17804]|uniref:FAD/NAD(P)-binding domain-containing protein n=1 Tax=Saitoella complicata (strain BCRC 22490 / CBS 7301 / JCM 7358 / NBRC 10748 / NRRL Y-17804) TaxID=698492 RepID=A0A0E9NJ84_SAICN|nr:FAD/NAD(P)-binding domain-containing protein [Saitoella complicata NRRL Y-17804]ODQ49601.1 FAD/NAD(P)-binding domain-containing protein [Saitoella complicata NRRL Y-17804]GAO49766.1 hypothetical protein G7K_3908-t1 [Saitoella complicata NRRL Y-17804]